MDPDAIPVVVFVVVVVVVVVFLFIETHPCWHCKANDGVKLL